MAIHKRVRSVKLTAAITAVAAAAGVTLLTTPFAGAATAPATGTVYGADAATAVSGSYIVMLDQKADKADLAEEYGGNLRRNYNSAINGFSASGLSETEAKRLAADPAVSKVVQNKKFHIDATQDNPPSWGLDRIDQAETAGDGAYTYPDAAGEGVTAYVIDTGVRVTHKDFEGRATSGFDAIDNDDDADDGNGHGTHVAGTIAGAAHGVAKKAKIVGRPRPGRRGFGHHRAGRRGHRLGHREPRGPVRRQHEPRRRRRPGPRRRRTEGHRLRRHLRGGRGQRVERRERGLARPRPRGHHRRLVHGGRRAVVVLQLRVGRGHLRPGSDITSDWNDSDDGTNTISGTSMATPHVVGAAAVYLGGHPDATPEEVATALTDGATPDAISNATEGTANKLLKIVE